MKHWIIAATLFITSCSSGSDSRTIDFTSIANQGMVLECNRDSVSNAFAYNINENTGLMDYWSAEDFGIVVHRRIEFDKGYGEVSNTNIDSPDSMSVTFYSALGRETLTDAGTLSQFKWLPIINGGYDVVGRFDASVAAFRIYSCKPVDHDLAMVDGVLLSQTFLEDF